MTDPTKLLLRDIHLPEPVSWWPPAPGWWVLLGTGLVIFAVLYFWKKYRIQQQFTALNLAKAEFSAIELLSQTGADTKEIVTRLSVLLRRLSISLYPRAEVAGLTGEAWLKFLDNPLPTPQFSSGPGRVLLEAPYRPSVNTSEIKPLLEVCRDWIDAIANNKKGKHDDQF